MPAFRVDKFSAGMHISYKDMNMVEQSGTVPRVNL